MNQQPQIPSTTNQNFNNSYNQKKWNENRIVGYPNKPEFTRESLPQQEDMLYQFLDFIQKHYADEQLNLDTIAKAMSMSQKQLHRKVKQFVNQSPISYLRAYRLQKSIELLVNSNVLSISEIAYRVGFSDPNYFSRVFSTTFDQTPSEYRKKVTKEP